MRSATRSAPMAPRMPPPWPVPPTPLAPPGAFAAPLGKAGAPGGSIRGEPEALPPVAADRADTGSVLAPSVPETAVTGDAPPEMADGVAVVEPEFGAPGGAKMTETRPLTGWVSSPVRVVSVPPVVCRAGASGLVRLLVRAPLTGWVSDPASPVSEPLADRVVGPVAAASVPLADWVAPDIAPSADCSVAPVPPLGALICSGDAVVAGTLGTVGTPGTVAAGSAVLEAAAPGTGAAGLVACWGAVAAGAVGAGLLAAADPVAETPEPEPALPAEDVPAGVTAAAGALPLWDEEAADTPPGAAKDAVTEDAVDVAAEMPVGAELTDTDAGLSGEEASGEAWACRESSSKSTQMPAATSATCTARRAIRRAISCGISSPPLPVSPTRPSTRCQRART